MNFTGSWTWTVFLPHRMAHGLLVPDLRSNLYPRHWKADPWPPGHQGSPWLCQFAFSSAVSDSSCHVTSLPAFGVISSWGFRHSNSVQWYLIVVLICKSLMTMMLMVFSYIYLPFILICLLWWGVLSDLHSNFFFFWLHWVACRTISQSGWNPNSQQWQQWVLIIGLPGNSLLHSWHSFLFSYLVLRVLCIL